MEGLLKRYKKENLLQKPKLTWLYMQIVVQVEDLKPKYIKYKVANPDGDRKGCQRSFVEQCENISSVREPRSTGLLLKDGEWSRQESQDKELLKDEIDQEIQIGKKLRNQCDQNERKMKKKTVMIWYILKEFTHMENMDEDNKIKRFFKEKT